MRIRFHLIALLAAALATGGASAAIVAAEYFIDTDPGQGNGVLVELAGPVNAASIAVDVPASMLAALPAGHHRLAVRFQDEEGEWSEAFSRTFSKDAVSEPRMPTTIVAAEYFVDEDPGQGLGTPVEVVTAGDLVSLGVEISPAEFAALAEGTRRLGVRVLDDAGNWSETFARTFSKDIGVEPLPERFMAHIEYQWHAAGVPVGEALRASAPSGVGIHAWLPELPMPAGEEGQVFQLVVTAYDTEGTRGDAVTREVKLALPPALAEVLAKVFPGAKPEDLGPEGNPLGDIFNNLQKYYLGLDPAKLEGGAAVSLFVPETTDSPESARVSRSPRNPPEAAGRIGLRFQRSRYTRGVTGIVESSATLAADSWEAVGTVEEVSPLDAFTDEVIVRLPPPEPGETRRFLRLRVEEKE